MFSAHEKSFADKPSNSQPDKLPDKLIEKKIDTEECLNCKIVSTVGPFAIAAYMAYLRMNTVVHAKGQRLFLTAFGTGNLNIYYFYDSNYLIVYNL